MTCPPHWWVGTGEKRGNTHELFRCRRCGGTCWLPITWDAVMKEKKKPQKGLRPQPKRDPAQEWILPRMARGFKAKGVVIPRVKE